MERLTEINWGNLDPWECCGQDRYCQRGCHDIGGCEKGCMVPQIYRRLAAYEDTGFTPEGIKALRQEKCTADTKKTMNDYLIIYGDGSHFYVSAPNFIDAFFVFMKYKNISFSPTIEKALKAMDTPSEFIELYSRFCLVYEEIHSVYEVNNVLYSDGKDGT